jgi:hypothetical protein
VGSVAGPEGLFPEVFLVWGREGCVSSDTRAVGGRVLHFTLDGTGDTLVEGGKGLGGEGTWSRGGGLPVVRDAGKAKSGVLGGLC